MSVTFAAKQPMMAKTQFGHQNQQPKASNNAKFSGTHTAGGPKQVQFGDGGCCTIPLGCCSIFLLLIAGIIFPKARPWNWFKKAA